MKNITSDKSIGSEDEEVQTAENQTIDQDLEGIEIGSKQIELQHLDIGNDEEVDS